MNGCIVLLMLPFVIPIILAIGGIIWLINKGKNEGWEGTVIDKIHTANEDIESDKTNHLYTLLVKTKERDRKVAVSAEQYTEFAIGDAIKKPKGKLRVQKG